MYAAMDLSVNRKKAEQYHLALEEKISSWESDAAVTLPLTVTVIPVLT